jgi:hypothetical protein
MWSYTSTPKEMTRELPFKLLGRGDKWGAGVIRVSFEPENFIHTIHISNILT